VVQLGQLVVWIEPNQILFNLENLFTNSRLVCDYPKGKAFLQVA